jgi:hypothetical protein
VGGPGRPFLGSSRSICPARHRPCP